ncbi:MAG: hypothetical protein ACK4NC_01495 [Candidatus Gracilibacteria bacterium]
MKNVKTLILVGILTFGGFGSIVTGCAPVSSINVAAMPDGIYRDSEGLFEIRAGKQYRLSGNATPTPSASASTAPGKYTSLDNNEEKGVMLTHYSALNYPVIKATRISSTYYEVTFEEGGVRKIDKVTIENGNVIFTLISTPTPSPSSSANVGSPVINNVSATGITSSGFTVNFGGENLQRIESRLNNGDVKTLYNERSVTYSGLSADTNYSVELKGFNSNGSTFTFTYTVRTATSNNVTSLQLNADQSRLVVSQTNGSNFVVKQESGNNSRKDSRIGLDASRSGDNVNLVFGGLNDFNGKTFTLIMTSNSSRPTFTGTVSGGSVTISVPQIPGSVSTSVRDTYEGNIDGNVGVRLYVGRE